MFSYYLSVFLLIIIILKLYSLLTKNNNYFRKLNIKYINPIPFFGTSFKSIFGLKSWFKIYQDFYDKFPNERLFGIFEFTKPVYVIRDVELIKQILIKQFDHFENHRNRMDENIEPLYGRNLFMMRDNRWKEMRGTLSPTFTGSKMKILFQLVEECSKRTCDDVANRINKNSVELDVQVLFRRFAADVIASGVFGIDINSDQNCNDEFYKMGCEISNFSGIQGLKYLGFTTFPGIMKFFNVKFYNEELRIFFRNLVLTTIQYRENHGIIRHDMLNLLIQTRKGILVDDSDHSDNNIGYATTEESTIFDLKKFSRKWDDDDLVAQCVIFLLAGFDTSSTILGFIAYELALNWKIQQKLINEIDEISNELNGNSLTYEKLQKMKYLDMVVTEALRKYPPVPTINRECSNDCTIENIKFKTGDGLWIPIHAIQNDHKYFPNPNNFDPERFSVINKSKINLNCYMPFGNGPRNCIGSRFALMECKAIIFNLLRIIEFETIDTTEIPMKFKKDCLFIKPEKGIQLRLKLRKGNML